MIDLGLNSLMHAMAQRQWVLARQAALTSPQSIQGDQRSWSGRPSAGNSSFSERLAAIRIAMDSRLGEAQRASTQAAVVDQSLTRISTQLDEALTLATTNADQTLSLADRQANQLRIDSILSNIDGQVASTSSDQVHLLDGTAKLRTGNRVLAIADVSTASLGKLTIDDTEHSLSQVRSGGELDTSAGDDAVAGRVIEAARRQIGLLRDRLQGFQTSAIAPAVKSLSSATAGLAWSASAADQADQAGESSRWIRTQMLQWSPEQSRNLAAISAANTLSFLRGQYSVASHA